MLAVRQGNDWRETRGKNTKLALQLFMTDRDTCTYILNIHIHSTHTLTKTLCWKHKILFMTDKGTYILNIHIHNTHTHTKTLSWKY